MTNTTAAEPVRRLRHSFVPARQKHLYELYRCYARGDGDPFFVDIAGPSSRMNFAQFVNYCTFDDALISVFVQERQIQGYFLFRDIQPELQLANLDFNFFGFHPEPGSDVARSLNAAISQTCCEHNISRMQMLALDFETSKIELLRWMGFESEGTLRDHFFFGGQHRDMIFLTRMERFRHGS